MELRTTLPEIFEEFGDARKNNFIKAKEVKDKGVPMIGVFCTFFPQEFAFAAGAATVGLCSVSDETIPDAEVDLPRNLCPLIKSSYGFALTDKCPYFYFSDLIVGETTCDGKKKMYEYLGQFKNVHVMNLPNSNDEDALKLWIAELHKLKDVIEKNFGVEITDEKLRAAVHQFNLERIASKKFYELQKNIPAPMSGLEMHKVLDSTKFQFEREKVPGMIDEIRERVMKEYNEKDHSGPRKPRIIVTGCPIGGVYEKTLSAIENAGAEVVAFENCGGAKSFDELVDENAPDIYEAIARRYLNIGCSVMSPNPNRILLMDRLVDEFQADAVIEITLQACHTYNVETLMIKRFCNDVKKIPYMHIETDYSNNDVGQIQTRVGAFIEMLG